LIDSRLPVAGASSKSERELLAIGLRTGLRAWWIDQMKPIIRDVPSLTRWNRLLVKLQAN